MSLRGYAPAGALTPRMRDVLRCAAQGMPVAATARELQVSEQTVRTVRAALCARLGVPNMTAAVDAGWRTGALR